MTLTRAVRNSYETVDVIPMAGLFLLLLCLFSAVDSLPVQKYHLLKTRSLVKHPWKHHEITGAQYDQPRVFFDSIWKRNFTERKLNTDLTLKGTDPDMKSLRYSSRLTTDCTAFWGPGRSRKIPIGMKFQIPKNRTSGIFAVKLQSTTLSASFFLLIRFNTSAHSTEAFVLSLNATTGLNIGNTVTTYLQDSDIFVRFNIWRSRKVRNPVSFQLFPMRPFVVTETILSAVVEKKVNQSAGVPIISPSGNSLAARVHDGTIVLSSSAFRIVHSIGLSLCWLLLIPASNILMNFHRLGLFPLYLLLVSSTFGIIVAFFSRIDSPAKAGISIHEILGYLSFTGMVIQAIFAVIFIVARHFMIISIDEKAMKNAISLTFFVFFPLSVASMVIGIKSSLPVDSDAFKAAIGITLIMSIFWILLLVGTETWRLYIRKMSTGRPDRSLEEAIPVNEKREKRADIWMERVDSIVEESSTIQKKDIKLADIPSFSAYSLDTSLSQLVTFTWLEINEMVRSGRKIVIYNGVNVHDLSLLHQDFMPTDKILRQVIGTDITKNIVPVYHVASSQPESSEENVVKSSIQLPSNILLETKIGEIISSNGDEQKYYRYVITKRKSQFKSTDHGQFYLVEMSMVGTSEINVQAEPNHPFLVPFCPGEKVSLRSMAEDGSVSFEKMLPLWGCPLHFSLLISETDAHSRLLLNSSLGERAEFQFQRDLSIDLVLLASTVLRNPGCKHIHFLSSTAIVRSFVQMVLFLYLPMNTTLSVCFASLLLISFSRSVKMHQQFPRADNYCYQKATK